MTMSLAPKATSLQDNIEKNAPVEQTSFQLHPILVYGTHKVILDFSQPRLEKEVELQLMKVWSGRPRVQNGCSKLQSIGPPGAEIRRQAMQCQRVQLAQL